MIRKTLIAAAALAALTSGFAGGAEARLAANGNGWNGVSLNSFKFNGLLKNGLSLNAGGFNGVSSERFAPALESVILPSGVILLAR